MLGLKLFWRSQRVVLTVRRIIDPSLGIDGLKIDKSGIHVQQKPKLTLDEPSWNIDWI